MGFAELIFTSLIQISAINPKSKHYVTFATPRDVPVRRAKVTKAFIANEPAERRRSAGEAAENSAARRMAYSLLAHNP